MARNDQPPLFTSKTLEEVNDRLAELDHADRLIEQGMRAGFDMKGQQEKSAEVRAQLLRFKQAFFPGK